MDQLLSLGDFLVTNIDYVYGVAIIFLGVAMLLHIRKEADEAHGKWRRF